MSRDKDLDIYIYVCIRGMGDIRGEIEYIRRCIELCKAFKALRTWELRRISFKISN